LNEKIWNHDGTDSGNCDEKHVFTKGVHEIVVDYHHNSGEATAIFSVCRVADTDLAALTAAASQADVVVFVGGIGTQQEEEGRDRGDIELPEVQGAAIRALKASGKPVVLVLCCATSMGVPWEAENLDAILQAWYPGQEGGTAVADVLFGDYNPAGRLPVTFYRATSDLPDYLNYSMLGRTYRYFQGPVLWPFGHGLSYTTFTYGKPEITCAGQDCSASFKLANTGAKDGEDVPQVYVKTGKAGEPIKSLRGFKRLAVKAGASEQVQIPLPASSFEIYDEATDKLVVAAGTYQVCVGGCSASAENNCVSVTLQ
jgi:beta-glucosidase